MGLEALGAGQGHRARTDVPEPFGGHGLHADRGLKTGDADAAVGTGGAARGQGQCIGIRRTANPIENTFASVRHRAIRSKGSLSNRAALAMVFPGRAIEAALLWTDGPTLMALPPALLDAIRPADARC